MLEQHLIDQFIVSETEFALTSETTNKVAVIINDNIALQTPQIVASEINETNESISVNKSFYTILEMTTTNTKLSPVLDTQRMSAFTIQNRLNSPTSSNTPSFVADTTTNKHIICCCILYKTNIARKQLKY